MNKKFYMKPKSDKPRGQEEKKLPTAAQKKFHIKSKSFKPLVQEEKKAAIPAQKKYKIEKKAATVKRPTPAKKTQKKSINLPKIKKIPMPKWLKNFFEKLKKFFSKKIVSRLAVALCAVILGGVLILWDLGIIKLPFLTRRDRRDPVAETETKEETETKTEQKETKESISADDKLAIDTIRSLYAFAGVNLTKTPITADSFRSDRMTITKQILPEGSFSTSMGFMVSTIDGKDLLFTANNLQEIFDSEGYRLTKFRTAEGDAVFTKDKTEGYFRYDPETKGFVSISFDTKGLIQNDFAFPLPRTYGKADPGTKLTREGGLYGYRGTPTEDGQGRSFTVPNIYTTAFNYSEGFAVMADAKGKVTIRGDRGQEVFTNYDFVLPDLKGEDALGFHYFDGGVLRVIVAGYDKDGKLTSRRETMINTKGQEVTLPTGYSVVSLHEGILLVSDGEKYGYLSANGAWISPPVYSEATPFYEGLAVVTDQNGKMGLIDSEGKTVLPCAFEIVTNFSDGHALCYSKATGWYLLTKVSGIYYHDPSQDEEALHTKISLTRGPQNTFEYEPDEIIELPPILSTVPRTTHPENTTSQAAR